jgi:hypothetical protein
MRNQWTDDNKVTVTDAAAAMTGSTTSSAFTRDKGQSLGVMVGLAVDTADNDATYTLSLTECDTVGGSYTAVAAEDISGDTGTFTMAQFVTNGNKLIVNYLGSKKFIKAVVTVASLTSGATYVTFIFIESGRKLNTGS